MKSLLLTAFSLAVLAAAASAAPAHTPTKAAALVCPITGEKIASASSAAGHETYKGKTYYFCCSACKPAFDKNRDKAAAEAARRKPSVQ